MTAGQPVPPPAQPVIPPMQPGGTQIPRQGTTWSTVIGIIAIVLGALGILGGCMNIASPLFLDVLKDMMPPEQVATMEVMKQWQTWTIISALLAMGLATLLLLAGIGLHKRRRWGVQSSLVWSILKMLFVAVNAVFAYMIFQDTLTAPGSQMAGVPGLGPGFFQFIGIFSVGFSVVWGWALPVFLLIWLLRAKIKAEVAEWS